VYCDFFGYDVIWVCVYLVSGNLGLVLFDVLFDFFFEVCIEILVIVIGCFVME